MRAFLVLAAAELAAPNLRKGEGFAQLDSVEDRLNKFQAELKGMGVNVAPSSSLLQTGERTPDPGSLHLDDERAKAKAETADLRRTIDEDADDFTKAMEVTAKKESLLQTGSKVLPELEMDDKTQAMKRDTRTLKLEDDKEMRALLAQEQQFDQQEGDASSLLERSHAHGKRFAVPRGVSEAEDRLAAVEGQMQKLDDQFREKLDSAEAPSMSSFVQEEPADAPDAPASGSLGFTADAEAAPAAEAPADDALADFEKEANALGKIDLKTDAERLQHNVQTAMEPESLLQRTALSSLQALAKARKGLDELDYGTAPLTGEVEGLGTVDVSDLVHRAGSYLQGAPQEQPVDALDAATQGGAQMARDLLALRDNRLAKVPAPGSLLAQSFETPDGKTRPIGQW